MMLLLPKVLLLGVLTGSPFWLQGCSEFELPSDRRLQAEPLPPAVAPLAPPVPPAPLPPMPTLPPPATLDETLKKKPKPVVVTPEPILGCPPPPLAGAVPSPPPPGYTPRLIVRNLCPNLDMWIASSGNVPGERNVKIPPNGTHQYFIPPGGLSSTRFWPKLWCNEYGQNCAMGSSGGDCQDCSQAGCAPPVDSKFEASFGALGVDCAVDNKGCDWWDTSAVDGFSLPYEVKVDKCPQGKNINCLGLSLGQCPSSEILGAAGAQDLRVVDPASKKVVGCYSPCGKLTYSNWHNPIGAHAPNSEEAKMFCCPTPPVSSEACRMGPVEQTQFVKLIHQSCPNVYGYAYDDAVGLQVCPSGTTYTWSIGCPTEPKGSLYF